MLKPKPTKTDVIAVRIDQETKEKIAAIGKTPTEMINEGLQQQIGSHTHVLLEQIYKRKLEQGWLSQKDWEYLSLQIYQSFETMTFTHSRFTSAQILDIYDAFRDLLNVAISKDSSHIRYYRGNLGSHTEAPASKSGLLEAIEAAKQLIHSHGDKHPWSRRPFSGLIGRNLNVALRDEKMDELEINKALIPHWHTIWHIVASKHWHDFEVPINVMTNENWAPLAKGEEVFSEGNTTITVWTLDDRPGIQTNIILERQDIFWHPNTYPEIEELQRALSSIPKKIEQEHNYNTFWNGPAFKVSVQKTSIVLLIKKGEANISFAQPEWESFRKMFNQALTQRDIPLRVAALKLQYGSSF